MQHELPGVGENYRDHYAPRMNWRVKLPVTLNERSRGLALAREVVKYYTQRRGILTFTAGIVFGFVKTRPGTGGARRAVPFRSRQLRQCAEARPGNRARHDADGLSVPAGVERLDPRPVERPAGGAGDPPELSWPTRSTSACWWTA